MVEVKVFTKKEYVALIPPVSTGDYERLKNSIKEEDGLLVPVILNQDNVVLDGHHRLRACKELGIEAIYNIRDFTNKPIDELKFVVSVNLHRRHLDDFQRAEIGIKMVAIARRIARQNYESKFFTRETSLRAHEKRYGKQYSVEPEDGGIEESGDGESLDEVAKTTDNLPLVSGDTPREKTIEEQEEELFAAVAPGGRTREQLAKFCGVSPATMARVETILSDGTPDQISSLRDTEKKKGKKPGVRTTYEEVQAGKLRGRLSTKGVDGTGAVEKKKDNVQLIKDFRLVDEIKQGTVDLVFALDFPEPRTREDEWGRLHEQLMHSAQDWLKDGGLLVMHVPQDFIPRVICQRPPMIQFNRIIAVNDDIPFWPTTQGNHMFSTAWRPYAAYVKGPRDILPNPGQHACSDRFTAGEQFAEEKDFVADMVKRLSPAGATVVDPFMGQTKGSLGEAALEIGRKYIGIERETTLFLTVMDKLHNVG
jgi:hypothetical protein